MTTQPAPQPTDGTSLSASLPGTATKRVAAAAMRERISLMWKGSPGEGKTAEIESQCRAQNLWLETIILSTRESVDLNGYAMIDTPADGSTDGRPVTTYTDLDWAVRANNAVKHGYAGAAVFFDEFSTALLSSRKGGLRIFQERVVGSLPLADHVVLIGAMNPVEEAVDGFELAAPESNRFLHLDWEFDSESWHTGLLTGFNQPTVIDPDTMLARRTGPNDAAYARAASLVSGFLRANEARLNPGPPKDPIEASGPWCSPRSWHNVARLLAHLRRGDDSAILLAVQGLVGESAATEFIAYLATADLYNPLDVIEDPSIVDWASTRPDILFVTLTSVAAVALNAPEQRRNQTWTKAVKVMVACASAHRTDVALPAMRTLLAAQPAGIPMPRGTRQAFGSLFAAMGRWGTQNDEGAA